MLKFLICHKLNVRQKNDDSCLGGQAVCHHVAKPTGNKSVSEKEREGGERLEKMQRDTERCGDRERGV